MANATYIQRAIEPVVRKAAAEFPAVVLTGPRQSGKTTLLELLLFARTHNYISLETPDVRLSAISDPRGFLKVYEPPIIMDEIQYAPELLPYIKEHIDKNRHKNGQYLLTGSQNLLMMEQVTESLAGRAAMLKLLPLSQNEVIDLPDRKFPWEHKTQLKTVTQPGRDLWKEWLRGFYPELVAQPERDQAQWHSSYMQTYLERDIRSLRQIGDLSQFQMFLRLLASRNGQLLNLTDFSRDLGLSVNTIKAWLSILEASFQIVILRPYFSNIGKRMVKTPKVYFTDSGMLCHLVGLKDPIHAAASPMAGAIFEGIVLMEIIKRIVHRGEDPAIYFWRTASGAEVDIVVAVDDRLVPIEVKLSSTPKPSMASGISMFREDFGSKSADGYVINTGDMVLPLSSNATSLPFAAL